jgi:adenylate cyclase
MNSFKRNTVIFALTGATIGSMVGLLEYFYRLKTNDDPQALLPLLARASFAGITIILSVAIFEALFSSFFRKKSFVFIVFFRSIAYTILLTGCLFLSNFFWFLYNGYPVLAQLSLYFGDTTYLFNMATALSFIVLAMGFYQINTLHRKGELFNFIIGRYHTPMEVERIFCFIDLKGSTTIAEKLGHLKFADFLKDYYSDITAAIKKTNAQIYQYIGDEIVLNWSYEQGLKENRMVNCYFFMKGLIEQKKDRYLNKYGFYPEFKAGLHGGKVTVTWVGELKKEIVYIGDVLNTASRIQAECNRLSKDFLISGDLLEHLKSLSNIQATFVESIVPRGKEKSIRLYSIEQTDNQEKSSLKIRKHEL